jgi:tetratricopeptide (TPR) repeat protein
MAHCSIRCGARSASRDVNATPDATAQGRMSGLSADAARLLAQAGEHLERRDVARAMPLVEGARALEPNHPEVLRLWSVAQTLAGKPVEAIAALRRAIDTRPDDALLHNNLGSALRASGDMEGAVAAFRRATELAPTLAAAWYNLGRTLKSLALSDEAGTALERAVSLAPRHVSARIVHGDNLKALGRIEEAEAAYRKALRHRPDAAFAWWGLANLKTVRFDAADAQALMRCFEQTDRAEDERAVIGFALAKALEDQDRYADAFAILGQANALRRRQQPWDAAAFTRTVDAIIAAFSKQPMTPAQPRARGHEVIFIVSMPRSGSTLIEQIIAAHPDVEGAGELPDLSSVIDDESRRRGAAFPEWVAAATDDDWKRLGESYLERTVRWRERHARFTDTSLLNGPYVGTAAAMLPGARFVHCRRDAVETALSCYRQWFNHGQAFSYDLNDIAAYRRDHERLMSFWSEHLPGTFFTQVHEDLLAEPEASVRRLLDFCGLPFDPGCLEFHRSARSVRTASAAQVREPLRRDTGRATRYGASLEPLRRALAGA